ncbi:zinc dependent phospholipase C family protein [Halobacillus salinarum]|uniref:Zinc dependent phospholipase C family protein n=1 Tax=Halobacillus salinarum TaxID=2932257 RepID=A0ABY4ES84_9BACI|nr:zinc dependent phospholipase C family protein [Halobacillus salinarum]UOQ46514.1 zinc dependent phospholipase C family protein [Halobacillus salinarum]
MFNLPNVWTHCLFAEDLCRELKENHLVETSSGALNFGAQGPDPFFYHNFWPFKADQGVSEIGMKLHTEKCGPFLLDMIENGKNAKNQQQAFILGYISHHMLDRNTHPYIHYHSGYEGNKHQELEVIIDTCMLERLRGLKSWKNPVYQKLSLQDSSHSILSMLRSLILSHFPGLDSRLNGDYIKKSYQDMRLAQRILFDPVGWKNRLLGSFVSSYSHQPLKDRKDYLNDTKRTWKHSATLQESNQSFIELYEKAFSETAALWRSILNYWQTSSKVIHASITDHLGDISYDTGLPLREEKVNQFSEPIV